MPRSMCCSQGGERAASAAVCERALGQARNYVICLARLAGTAPGAKPVAKKGPDAVAIADFRFGPEKLEVPRGTDVRWTDTDDSPHQVSVAGSKGTRSEVMPRGQTAFMKFEAPAPSPDIS